MTRIFSCPTDFKTFQCHARGLANWKGPDGLLPLTRRQSPVPSRRQTPARNRLAGGSMNDNHCMGCVLGIEPNEHQTPRFQGFPRQTMECSQRFMCRFRQSMDIICPHHGYFSPNHPHHLPKPRCFWLFDGLFSPIAADGLLFLAGSLS